LIDLCLNPEEIDGQGKLIYEFGPYRLDPGNYRLLRGGQDLRLHGKAFDLLVILAKSSGRTLTKEELLEGAWKGTVVEEGNLAVHVTTLRKLLGADCIETVAGRGYRFVPHVKVVPEAMPFRPSDKPGPPTGALQTGDPRYVARATDAEFRNAIERGDGIVLVKGSRQVGKSSLLARALQKARESGCAVVQIDLQSFSLDVLESLEKILLAIGTEISIRLGVAHPNPTWSSMLGPSMAFAHFLEFDVLAKIDLCLVLGLDEVDRLLHYKYANDIFGLFRSWHNRRALDDGGPWCRLTLALAYATEPHLFIRDLNQSPFNVGTRLTLSDFSYPEVAELNRRYDSVLSDSDLKRYCRLLGGHPYLLNSALHARKHDVVDLEDLEARAERNEGPFGEHLNRMLTLLRQDSALCEAVRAVLEQKPISDSDFYRLRSAGVLAGDFSREAKMRCELYSSFLHKRLG
jgi:DNA-binding winged helix-turn-helix (wHTH) protein